MHIPLPNGDVLIPDAEFLKLAGDVTARTGNGWDQQGCPHVLIGGRKYRPKTKLSNGWRRAFDAAIHNAWPRLGPRRNSCSAAIPPATE